MPVAYCEEADVRKALQENSLSGSIGSEFVKDEIHGVSKWLANATNSHWYDSTGSGTLIDNSIRTASNVTLDVPSSPHAQPRNIISSRRDVQYPVTKAGRYAELPLPHLHVDSITKLEVRQRDGDVTDWVADSDKTEGRGDEYYLQTRGQNSYGRSYLYLDAKSMGPRVDYGSLLTLKYDYGMDSDNEEWRDVRRGVALLAAAQLTVDDDVLTSIPDNGQLIGVDSKAQRSIDQAMRLLDPYF